MDPYTIGRGTTSTQSYQLSISVQWKSGADNESHVLTNKQMIAMIKPKLNLKLLFICFCSFLCQDKLNQTQCSWFSSWF